MKYRDDKDKIIYNGDTTIVYGVGIPTNPLVQKLADEFASLYYETDGLEYSNPIYVQGVTHKDSKDAYDKTIGVKVASRKAELKARRKMYKRFARVKNKLVELQNLVFEELRDESARIRAIYEELDEIRKK